MSDDREFDKRKVYQIRVKGVLDSKWSDWFDGFTITPQANGETLVTGPVADQAALHGLLIKVRDLGLPHREHELQELLYVSCWTEAEAGRYLRDIRSALPAS